MRIGQGIDLHAFSSDPTRPLILCGVIVEGAPGLDGHSDADVATHSLIDAILGASGLGDLGRHFPSGDDRFAGASSLDLLEVGLARLRHRASRWAQQISPSWLRHLALGT